MGEEEGDEDEEEYDEHPDDELDDEPRGRERVREEAKARQGGLASRMGFNPSRYYGPSANPLDRIDALEMPTQPTLNIRCRSVCRT